MTEATTRTQTFVFTGIEGSTRLLRALGEGYADVLRARDRIIRDAAEAHGGRLLGASHRLRDESGTNLLDEDVSFRAWEPRRLPTTPEERRALEEG